ncbi:hypothetical protein ACFU7Y_40075 [Kitasatospora sp. NPDC057542]|uniref:hypothetical protein n=1 Tax=Kitasatospora sp. NPDC057542 TaxID=3346162 RepID=UPI0036B4D57E
MNITPDQQRTTRVTAKRVLAATAAALSLVATAACGPDKTDNATGATTTASPSPTERLESMTGAIIIERAQQDFLKAATVKVTGHSTNDGHKIDFTVQTDDHGNCKGSLTTADLGTMQFLRTSGQTLAKPDVQALTKLDGPAVAGRMNDRWLRLAPGDTLTAISQLCERKTIPVFGDGTSSKQALNMGSTTVTGVKAVSILAVIPGAFTGHVSTETPARPLRVESEEQGVAMDFTDYGAPLDVTLPPADQITDLAAVKQDAGT